MPPRVAVILLNWNNYPESMKCLDTLATCTYSNLRVVIVDNGSTDGSGERLHHQYPQHTYVQTGSNLGFARGCNAAIKVALEEPDTMYVLLLNNDSVPRRDFIEPLVATAEADPRVGAVSGKVHMHGRRFWYAGGHIRRISGGVYTRAFGQEDVGQFDTPEDTHFVTGGLMLIPRRVVEKVGLLPAQYFFGFEEYDYSITLRQHGYRLRYEPRSVIYHDGDGSHSNWEPKYLYNSYRNKLILQQNHLPLSAITFPLWRRVFRWYTRLVGGRQRRRMLDRHQFIKSSLPPSRVFDYAIDEAIRDHLCGIELDEAALNAFDARWRHLPTGDSA